MPGLVVPPSVITTVEETVLIPLIRSAAASL